MTCRYASERSKSGGNVGQSRRTESERHRPRQTRLMKKHSETGKDQKLSEKDQEILAFLIHQIKICLNCVHFSLSLPGPSDKVCTDCSGGRINSAF
mmetsp:Transcript_13937/g.28641  ORF Transcript_13937/g.28641 Transcript_13937/m.28641 type:complete len:96 (-) Transcript_13937:133-420(-)